MIRKLAFSVVMVGAVVVGLVTQAGAYLLALTAPASEGGGEANSVTRFAGPGPLTVGVRWAGDDAPMPVTYWYPAIPAEQDRATTTYAFGINMLGSDTTTALATFDGRATVGAPPEMSAGPYPLVILSHGFAIAPSSYGWLAEQLASHGFVVAAPHHDESLDPGVLWKSTVQRPRELATLMTEIDRQSKPGGEHEGLIDSERVAVVGHSYGGYTAQVAGGARLDTRALGETCETARETGDPVMFLCGALMPRLDDMANAAELPEAPSGLWPDWSDPRVEAVVSIAGDAAMFGPHGLAEVEVPVLAIGGTADSDSPFGWGTEYTYNHAAAERKIEVGLEDAGHMIFAGECERSRRILDLVSLGFCSDGTWDRGEAHQIVSHYVTAFLLEEMTDDQDAAAELVSSDEGLPDVAYRAEGY